MSQFVRIEQVENGYIVEDYHGKQAVFSRLDDVFARLLGLFEGRLKTFTGKSYGEVRILRENGGANE